MYIEESEAEMYKIGYINSKSKLKTRDLPEIYTGGDLKDGDFEIALRMLENNDLML